MKFTSQDIKVLEEVFRSQYGAGYILDFSDKSMREFFEDEFSIDIENNIYKEDGKSKAKRLRGFIKKSDRETVLIVLDRLWQHRKSITNQPVTSADEMLYLHLIERVKKVDAIASQGIAPAKTETPHFLEHAYFLKELEAMKQLTPQQRGYRFESWLGQLFSAYRLLPNPGFNLTGEQIDGSFLLHNETYLVEAKWQSQKTSAQDLHVFQAKLDQKAVWARGVFISWQGFSKDAFMAWGRNKSVICVSGYDLFHMLSNNISLIELLERKIRHAAEKGEYYKNIDELFPHIKK